MERELRLASDEPYVRALWKRLYDGLALEGRGPYERGYDLRTHWMPKRLWEGLVELDPRSATQAPTCPPATPATVVRELAATDAQAS